MNITFQSIIESKNKENKKPLPSNSSSSKNNQNVSATPKSILAYASSRARRLKNENNDIEHVGGVLATLTLQDPPGSGERKDINVDISQSDSESTLSLQSSFYNSPPLSSKSQRRKNVDTKQDPIHCTTTKLFPTSCGINDEKQLSTKNSFVSPKPPTTQVTYLKQRNQFQLISPLEWGQSDVKSKHYESRKNPLFLSPLSCGDSSFPSSTSTNTEESEALQTKSDESSIDIYVYKKPTKKSSLNICSDDDSYQESEGSEASYDDEATEEQGDVTDASYIVQEPYIPYGKSLTQLDSAAKVFVKEEIIGSDCGNEDIETDQSYYVESNVNDSKTDDDFSNAESPLKNQSKMASSTSTNNSNPLILSHDTSIDNASQITVEAQILRPDLKSDTDSDRSMSVNIKDEVEYSLESDNETSSDEETNDASVSQISGKKDQSNCHLDKISRELSMKSLTSNKQIGAVKYGQWSLGSRIGEGSFGVVYVGMNNLTGNLMAVKKMKIPSSSLKEEMIDLQREIKLMQSFNHQNIVRYIGSEMERAKNVMYIFQEWVTGGSITHLLKKFGSFPLTVIRSYLSQILNGLEYLHSNRVLHRDIKGGNVLVSDEGIVKLADFGASKKIHVTANGNVVNMNELMEKMTVRGTPYYMAPEVFEGDFSVKADVWSTGCVAYEMLTGQPPWKAMGLKSPTTLFMHLHKTIGPPPMMEVNQKGQECDKKLQHLLTKCFDRDASKRPTVSTLLSHDFFVEKEVIERANHEVRNESFQSLVMSPISPKQLADMTNIKHIDEHSKIGNCNEEVCDTTGWPIWAKLQPPTIKSKGNPFY